MIVYIPFSGVTAQSPVGKHLSIRLMKALPMLVWNCLDISVEWWVEHIGCGYILWVEVFCKIFLCFLFWFCGLCGVGLNLRLYE